MDKELVNEIKSFLNLKKSEILKGETSVERYEICVNLLKSKYVISTDEIARIDDVIKWRVMANASFMIPYIIRFISTGDPTVMKAYYAESVEIVDYINLICK